MFGLLKKIYWMLNSQLGVDPRRFFNSLRGIPFFVRDWLCFRRLYTGRMGFLPCLHDRMEEAGSFKGEYFWQDLFFAQKVHLANPVKHVDIGSRLDGFVAHVASFREIEVVDIRPVTVSIPQVVFRQADFMDSSKAVDEYCDSLSSLHALEHFGLGRYGDKIDPEGHLKGLKNMARILKADGALYLSVPVGKARVEFNAHRIFDPVDLVRLAKNFGLEINSFASFHDGKIHEEPEFSMENLMKLANIDYALGMFVFKKVSS